ncbi:outer membrane protein assembly factor BamE [Ottowia sp. VDI28]|uniref:outer membrane protein assembly factor BamE n=1 Tax=Ottowia sp. VDI28 TaxID=3133968 RepID=UPI003C2C112B
MRLTTASVIASASLLVGCQAMMYGTAADLNKLSIGMTRPQVIETLGTPTTVHADSDKREEYLVYRRMSHVVSWEPQNYQVTFRDGKVVRYGEQSTENSGNR